MHVQCAPGLLSHDGSAINERHASPATHNPMNLFFHANAGSLVPTPCMCPECASPHSKRPMLLLFRIAHTLPKRFECSLLTAACCSGAPQPSSNAPIHLSRCHPSLLLGKGDSYFPGGAPVSRLQSLWPLDTTTPFAKQAVPWETPTCTRSRAITCTWPTLCQICHSCSC